LSKNGVLDKPHNAVNRLEYFARKVSQNYSCSCFALKCDVKKFFASIDHRLLKEIISRKIKVVDSITDDKTDVVFRQAIG